MSIKRSTPQGAIWWNNVNWFHWNSEQVFVNAHWGNRKVALFYASVELKWLFFAIVSKQVFTCPFCWYIDKSHIGGYFKDVSVNRWKTGCAKGETRNDFSSNGCLNYKISRCSVFIFCVKVKCLTQYLDSRFKGKGIINVWGAVFI